MARTAGGLAAALGELDVGSEQGCCMRWGAYQRGCDFEMCNARMPRVTNDAVRTNGRFGGP